MAIVEGDWFKAEMQVLEVGPDAYRVRGESSRGNRAWVKSERTYRSPYLGQRDWAVGHQVVIKHFGDFPSESGEIVQLPSSRNGSYKVKVAKRNTSEWVKASKLFNEVRAARVDDLTAGAVVSRKPGYWVLIMGVQGDQVVIRQGPTDSVVSLSELEICR